MKTKMMLKKIAVLVGMLMVLVSINGIGYAIVMEDGKDETKLPIIEERGGLVRPDEIKRQEPEYAPGEVIIKLKEPAVSKEALFAQPYSVTKASHEDILSNLKSKYNLKDEKPVFEALHKLNAQEEAKLPQQAAKGPQGAKQPNLLHIYILKTDEDIPETCAKLKQDPDIEYAEPNYKVEIQMLPNDPYYHSTGSWGQSYDDLWGIKKLQCEQAWDITQGEGVVVAVIDTGVDYNHEDIADNIWINEDEILDNGIDDDNNGYIDDVKGWNFAYDNSNPMDGHGHGSHVAGTIAGIGNNNTGIIGVAPNAKIMAIKGLGDEGSGYTSDLVNCVIYAADNGAHVLSNSWGGYGTSQLLVDAFHYAHSRGCVSIAAAGNSDMDVSNFTPANINTVMAIAASNQNDNKCSFSNWGEKIDVAAPGGDSPTGDGSNYFGRNVLSLRSDHNGKPTDMYGDGKCIVGEKYYRARGTSMACPHVAGVAALIISANPNLTGDEVRDTIRISADDIGTPGKDDFFGYGRINAYKAVGASRNICSLDISSPRFNSFVRGVVDIIGSAFIEDGFQRYELYYAPLGNFPYSVLVNASSTPVRDGFLGSLNTTQCPDGEYTLILKLFTVDNREYRRYRRIIVDNINEPPIFKELNDKASFIGKNLEFKIEIQDPDDPATSWGGQFEYYATDLPPAANFDGTTHTFSWERPPSDGNIYNVTFTVVNGEHTINKTIRLLPIEVIYTVNYTRTWGYICSIYEDKIGWADKPNGDYRENDIYLYDLATKELAQITNDAAKQGGPFIYKDKLVWIDSRNHSSTFPGNYDIYMYDLSLRKEIQITNHPAAQGVGGLRIYGDRIVWADTRNIMEHEDSSYMEDIWILDLSTNQLLEITDRPNGQAFPKIYEDKIIWIDYGVGTMVDTNIYMSNLTTGETMPITTHRRNQFGADIYGDKIVWTDDRKGHWLFGNTDIYMYDLSTSQEIAITDDIARQWHPKIHGDKIVWADTRNGNWDIYMYDLSTQQEIEIITDSNHQRDPLIFGDIITWQDHGSDIDGWVRPISWVVRLIFPPEITSIEPTHLGYDSVFTITGKHFGYAGDSSKVLFSNGAVATIKSWSNSKIVCQVPEGVQSDSLSVITIGGESNSLMILVIPEHAPVLDAIGKKIVEAGRILEFTIRAQDLDEDPLSFSINNRPQGASLTDNGNGTATFNWTPTYEQVGLHNTVFTVSDGKVEASEAVIIIVTQNVPPILDPIGDKRVSDGTELTFLISAVDLDGDPLSFSANNLPNGASFTDNGKGIGTFSWTPAYEQIGEHPVTFTVSDGKAVSYETILIRVDLNYPPELDTIGDKQGEVGKWLNFIVTATDPNGDTLTYSANSLTLSPFFHGQWFVWLPTNDDVGVYNITFKVSDGKFTDSETITITVTGTDVISPAPSNLAAIASSPTRIKLTWLDNSRDETGFKIEKSDDGTNFTQIAAVGADVRTYTITNLTQGNYYFRVRAYNNLGNSAYSNTATCNFMPPIAPINLTAQALSSTKIQLNWQDNSDNEKGFKVEISTDGTTFIYKGKTSANGTTFAITGLTPNTTYYFRVYAYNVVGNAYSDVIQATTMPLPLAPSNLTTQALSSTKIKVMWQDNSLDETGFKVEMSTDGTTFTYKGSAGADKTTYTVGGLTLGTVYYFRVYSIRGSDKSVYSEVVQGTTLPPPIAPSNLTATPVSSTRITLTWQDNSSDETGFKVEMSLDGATFSNKASLGANVTTYTVTGLTANTTYYFRAYSIRGADKSAYSEVVQGTTLPPPIAPSNLTATPVSSTRITLTWQDNSSDETGFKVEMSADGTTYVAKGSAKADITTCTISKLTPNTTYYFRVYAYRGTDKSAYSEVIQGTTLPLPVAPSNLTTQALSSTQLKLTWQDNSLDETGFRVEMSSDGITFSSKGSVGAGITTYTAGGLTTNTLYYFRVYAYRVSDKSSYSNIASGTTQ